MTDNIQHVFTVFKYYSLKPQCNYM